MFEELKWCSLCPRKCGVDRLNGKIGFCGAGRDVYIARSALHFWEEPCISGKTGSGTVFFSFCTMRCIFCQNYEISKNNLGYRVSEEELADCFLKLASEGANNINLVTPTHFVPQIKVAIDIARTKGMSLPIVYNTGGYETVETIKSLEGYVDIYMPDFKYFDNSIAKKYSRAEDYRECVQAAIQEMYRQTGDADIDKNGIMKRGIIVRHLMLPGCLKDTVNIINYVNKTFNDKVYFSLMSQYTPVRKIDEEKELNYTLSRNQYNAAVKLCERLGMENVFIQEGSAASESFIPEFAGKKDSENT